jgi:hypothetical protein
VTITSSKVFKAFAWLCVTVGFAMLMLESFLHYQHALARHPMPETAWSAVSISMGAVLILFGAGVLQYADTKKALELFGYIMPFVTQLLQSWRPGGRRASDPPAPAPGEIAVASTIAPPGTDPAIVAVLEAEAAKRREKHELNPPLIEGG